MAMVDSSTTSGTGTPSVPAMAWSPTETDLLLLPRVTSAAGSTAAAAPAADEGEQQTAAAAAAAATPPATVAVKKVMVSDGVGCNRHEEAALTKIVRYHEEYYEEGGNEVPGAPQRLSQEYRGAIRDCLASWDEDIAAAEQRGDGEGEQQQEADEIEVDRSNLFCLKATYDFMHLSDIFLPLLAEQYRATMGGGSSFYGGGGGGGDPFDAPGIVSADAVRYLRYNQLASPDALCPDFAEMIESMHPDQFGGGDGDGGTPPYWKVVETLVLRGCLDKAWFVLSRHSSYVEAVLALEGGDTDDPYLRSELEEIRDGFHFLRYLLLRAPLPGGRTDEYDDALSPVRGSEADDGIDDIDYQLGDLDVGTSDYKLWDAMAPSSSSFSDPTQQSELMMMTMVDNPALRKHRLWKDYVNQVRHQFPLSRRFPQLDSILAVVGGDLSSVRFGNWQERFCAELLYCYPDLCPRDYTRRIRTIMKQFGINAGRDSRSSSSNDEVEIILSIMDGNAGRAIEIMWMLGGRSSAALPSTLTTLMYNLFIESGIIPPEAATRKTEFLCDSAAAICCSLPPDSSIGPTLAIRLLLPYAAQGDRVIVATIAGILERHVPGNDAEASNLLSLCHPLLQMKSAHVLDGCCSIVLCRYRDHRRNDQASDAMTWLMMGVELESMVLPVAEDGSCYRALTADCNRTSIELLKVEVGEAPKSIPALLVATTMVEGLKRNDNNVGSAALEVPAVKVLLAVHTIGIDRSNSAEQVLACLEERTDGASDVQSTLAPWTMHWDLLRVAHAMILEEQDKVSSGEETTPVSAFGKRGITVLMDRLMYVCEFYSPLPEDQVAAMRAALGIALARAFVAENAQKKLVPVIPPWRNENFAAIRSCDLKKHSLGIQSAVVQSMLDY